MKTKAIVLFAVAVVVTLSFTLITVHNQDSENREAVQTSVFQSTNEPAGGFGSEDKL